MEEDKIFSKSIIHDFGIFVSNFLISYKDKEHFFNEIFWGLKSFAQHLLVLGKTYDLILEKEKSDFDSLNKNKDIELIFNSLNEHFFTLIKELINMTNKMLERIHNKNDFFENFEKYRPFPLSKPEFFKILRNLQQHHLFKDYKNPKNPIKKFVNSYLKASEWLEGLRNYVIPASEGQTTFLYWSDHKMISLANVKEGVTFEKLLEAKNKDDFLIFLDNKDDFIKNNISPELKFQYYFFQNDKKIDPEWNELYLSNPNNYILYLLINNFVVRIEMTNFINAMLSYLYGWFTKVREYILKNEPLTSILVMNGVGKKVKHSPGQTIREIIKKNCPKLQQNIFCAELNHSKPVALDFVIKESTTISLYFDDDHFDAKNFLGGK